MLDWFAPSFWKLEMMLIWEYFGRSSDWFLDRFVAGSSLRSFDLGGGSAPYNHLTQTFVFRQFRSHYFENVGEYKSLLLSRKNVWRSRFLWGISSQCFGLGGGGSHPGRQWLVEWVFGRAMKCLSRERFLRFIFCSVVSSQLKPFCQRRSVSFINISERFVLTD